MDLLSLDDRNIVSLHHHYGVPYLGLDVEHQVVEELLQGEVTGVLLAGGLQLLSPLQQLRQEIILYIFGNLYIVY